MIGRPIDVIQQEGLLERFDRAFAHSGSTVLYKLGEWQSDESRQHFVAADVATSKVCADLLGAAIDELFIMRGGPDIAVLASSVLEFSWQLSSERRMDCDAEMLAR